MLWTTCQKLAVIVSLRGFAAFTATATAAMPNDLYDEIDSMLSVSNLIYEVTFLNRWGGFEPGAVQDPNFLATLPRTTSDVVGWFEKNEDLLRSYERGATRRNYDTEFDMATLERLMSGADKNDASTLEVLDDKFAFNGNQSTIVYGITRNPNEKRITIVFRGSISDRDWEQNFKTRRKTVKLTPEALEQVVSNPNEQLLKEFHNVTLHSGFYDYLFELRSEESGKTKIVEVMKEVSKEMSDPRNVGYDLYFTGHSLGGALATLAASVAALSDDFSQKNKPVRLITFASPHVGKLDFATAFQKLERDGRIEHLRVTNNDDLTPQVTGLWPLSYRHTGLHLNLRKATRFNKRPYDLSRTQTKGVGSFTNKMRLSPAWLTDAGRGKNHRLEEHYRRLVASEARLKALTMDNLYSTLIFK